MEEAIKELAAIFASQNGLDGEFPNGMNKGAADGASPGGIGAILAPKSDDEILQILSGLPFEAQANFFGKYPYRRNLVVRLIQEGRVSEENSCRWTLEALHCLGDLLGLMQALQATYPATARPVIEEGLDIIRNNQ